MPTTFVVRTPAYRKEGNVCKGNLSRVSLARSVTRPQATGFALQNRTNTKKDTLLRVFFRVVITQHYRFLEIAFRKSVYDSKKNLMHRTHLSFDSSVVSETAPSSRSVTT